MLTALARHAVLFLCFLLCSWAVASGIYLLLAAVSPYTFGVWFRMFLYHYEYPYQYIFIVCLCYALAATCFFHYLDPQHPRIVRRCLGLLVVAVLCALPLGGLLWCFHDMMAGFIPSDVVPPLQSAITDALLIGPVLIALSIPYNVLCGCAGVKGTLWLSQKIRTRFPVHEEHKPAASLGIFVVLYLLLLAGALALNNAALQSRLDFSALYTATLSTGTPEEAETFLRKHALDVQHSPHGYARGHRNLLATAAANPHPQVLRAVLQRGTMNKEDTCKFSAAFSTALQTGRLDNALLLAEALAALPAERSECPSFTGAALIHHFPTLAEDREMARRIVNLLHPAHTLTNTSSKHELFRYFMRNGANLENMMLLEELGVIGKEDMNALLVNAGMHNPEPEVAAYLLRKGADPNLRARDENRVHSQESIPILALTALYNDNAVRILPVLLAAGADPNATDTFGQTVLAIFHREIQSRGSSPEREAIRHLLVEAGAR